MSKSRSKREGIVFSTDPDFEFRYEQDDQIPTPAPSAQKLRVHLDRGLKGGKVATVVRGFIGADSDLESLGKTLKSKCGVGGAVKDAEIILQGDHRNKIIEYLLKEGYSNTKASGG